MSGKLPEVLLWCVAGPGIGTLLFILGYRAYRRGASPELAPRILAFLFAASACALTLLALPGSRVETDVFFFFTTLIVWILSSLLAHHFLVRRGYSESESWTPGCLLGPLGLFFAVLTPFESPRASRILQFAGLFFMNSLMSVRLYLDLIRLLQPRGELGGLLVAGVLVLGETVVFIALFRKFYRTEQPSPAAPGVREQNSGGADDRASQDAMRWLRRLAKAAVALKKK